jgi:hypothetical protein
MRRRPTPPAVISWSFHAEAEQFETGRCRGEDAVPAGHLGTEHDSNLACIGKGLVEGFGVVFNRLSVNRDPARIVKADGIWCSPGASGWTVWSGAYQR